MSNGDGGLYVPEDIRDVRLIVLTDLPQPILHRVIPCIYHDVLDRNGSNGTFARDLLCGVKRSSHKLVLVFQNSRDHAHLKGFRRRHVTTGQCPVPDRRFVTDDLNPVKEQEA